LLLNQGAVLFRVSYGTRNGGNSVRSDRTRLLHQQLGLLHGAGRLLLHRRDLLSHGGGLLFRWLGLLHSESRLLSAIGSSSVAA